MDDSFNILIRMNYYNTWQPSLMVCINELRTKWIWMRYERNVNKKKFGISNNFTYSMRIAIDLKSDSVRMTQIAAPAKSLLSPDLQFDGIQKNKIALNLRKILICTDENCEFSFYLLLFVHWWSCIWFFTIFSLAILWNLYLFVTLLSIDHQ